MHTSAQIITRSLDKAIPLEGAFDGLHELRAGDGSLTSIHQAVMIT